MWAALEQSEFRPEDIDHIVMVGGSSKLPRVKAILGEIFPGLQIHCDIDPAEAIACGAAIYGSALQSALEDMESDGGDVDEEGIRVIEVVPRALGVEVIDGWMAVVVPRNAAIPCCERRVFTTSRDNARYVELSVYEGDGTRALDNHHLGDFRLTGIRRAKEGEPRIEVTFEYDIDRILTVKAVDLDTDATINVSLATSSAHSSLA